ncbi:MAG TPA: ABC transporter permease [Thermoanaerobaculaceae bacterium]|nr:ABC transporter permease [Thermoanaerobaculaceae bacterium]
MADTQDRRLSLLSRLLSAYGMFGVLVLLAAFFSVATIQEQQPAGEAAARSLARQLDGTNLEGAAVVIVGRGGDEDARFAGALARRVRDWTGVAPVVVTGDPAEARAALVRVAEQGVTRCVVATTQASAPVVRSILESLPALAGARVLTPASYRWPTFLLPENLRNVANQIAVIAILAVGMTMVIVTGGIDLSVGSLIALAAVVTASLIGRMGGEGAGTGAMVLGGLATMVLCGAIGAFSGVMITRFRVPPFIATLAVMQVASGLAYIISEGRPVYRLPQSFVLLGRGADPVLGIPWAVLLMGVLYAAAHVLMSRTTLGRYIYAVGGNAEAARLAGVRVAAVLLFVYAACGALAGLGGVVMASQLRSGAPTYGLMYELYVIAAVVVGGTSLSGGEGTIPGTLVGAFIIAVIQNGMNLTHVESYTQKVVLGLVILGAVLLDRLKQRGMRRRG